MKKIKWLSLILVMCLLTMGASSCDVDDSAVENADEIIGGDGRLSSAQVYRVASIEQNAAGKEQTFTEMSQAHFNQVQPPIQLEWSLERDQINERNQRWNDPNKISYIYLFDKGTLISYFPIKGKVSSVNSKLTANEQIAFVESSHYDAAAGAIESPAMDGSYGTNGDGIFFFLTDGTYAEWNGTYLIFDNPIPVAPQPQLVYDVTAEMQPKDTSTTEESTETTVEHDDINDGGND